ncbi:L-lactate dehydrogenase [Paenibacillus sambharensis]|uniref:L-lactate dehydrogenase n=1 Tax=Paenibacillus sambharensis TaxID=1803190 RepID=A0A2W1LG02_9BACL|nr:L-lactate dehydrogenase [Paenibacillus sambharensis]PZD97629.1 L-lactate dehydrogenase [Paenibacillus sambharensis]
MASSVRKVAIVGVGSVGSSCAYSLINQSVCDEIMLIGRTPDKAYAQAMDLSHCMDFIHSRTKIYTGTYEDCGDMDIIILCAGSYPTGSHNRMDVLDTAMEIHSTMISRIMASGFRGIFLAASNPVDLVTYMVWKLSGLPRNQVLGTGTSIDSSRLKTLLSDHLPVDPRSVQGYVLGEHGESQFPAWSHVTIGGKPILEIVAQHPARFGHMDLQEIALQTRNAGWEIFSRKGSTHYGIGNAIAYIVRSILNNDHKIIAVSAILEGEYGQSDLCIGVPAIITRSGIEEILELNLSPAEQEQFKHSCSVIRKAISYIALQPEV